MKTAPKRTARGPIALNSVIPAFLEDTPRTTQISTGEEEEGAGGHGHDRPLGSTSRPEGKAQPGAEAHDLAYRGDDEGRRNSRPRSNAVEKAKCGGFERRRPRSCPWTMQLVMMRPTRDPAGARCRGQGLERDVDDDDPDRDDQSLDDHPHAAGNAPSEDRDREVRHRRGPQEPRHMTIVLRTELVTARVEQMPRI